MASGPRRRNEGGRVPQTEADREQLAWWDEARFGMFIHWGLYSVSAGKWQGRDVPGIASWLMHRDRVPAAEYANLAHGFNPVDFDAAQCVRLARDAGMQYLVFTAKHHEGFSMYDSPASDYDIVDATPFGRDPIAELAAACRADGMPLGFYYSQDQDWHHPDGFGNDWDFPDAAVKDFDRYLGEKVKPQLRELLTNYGPICLIWFDTPYSISKAQSEDLLAFVREFQPDCLVSGRIGNGVGDYGSLGDNQIPMGVVEGAWETPATMNDTWGFKIEDHNWKSTTMLLHLLAELTGKGVNYLLNIGPAPEGDIPEPSILRLGEIGEWMRVNGEAIRGTSPNPFRHPFDWGALTIKGDTLFLLFTSWPGERFVLHGLRNEVKHARLLADPGTAVEIHQSRDQARQLDILELALPPGSPDPHVGVVALELDSEPDVDPLPLQQPDGRMTLIPSLATIDGPRPPDGIRLAPSGLTEDWLDNSNSLTWRIRIADPGRYAVQVVTGTLRHASEWQGGHGVAVNIAGATLEADIAPDEKIDSPRASYFPEFATRMGSVTVEEAGIHELVLEARNVDPSATGGLAVAAVILSPDPH